MAIHSAYDYRAELAERSGSYPQRSHRWCHLSPVFGNAPCSLFLLQGRTIAPSVCGTWKPVSSCTVSSVTRGPFRLYSLMKSSFIAPSWGRGKSIRTLTGHAEGIVSLNYDSNVLASGSVDATIKVWNLRMGGAFTLQGHSDWVNSSPIVGFEPDG